MDTTFWKWESDNNVVNNFVEVVDVYAKQLPENTILPALLALDGFTEDGPAIVRRTRHRNGGTYCVLLRKTVADQSTVE